jgi:hypothetical protein
MGDNCIIYEGHKKCFKILARKREAKRPLGE